MALALLAAIFRLPKRTACGVPVGKAKAGQADLPDFAAGAAIFGQALPGRTCPGSRRFHLLLTFPADNPFGQRLPAGGRAIQV
jgi:hypothetical protein